MAKVAEVITMQPTSNAVDTANVDVGTGLEQAEEEEKEKRKEVIYTSTYIDPGCCCVLDESDFLFHFWCCRMISNCFVGCSQCTERCCESCCSCMCETGDSGGEVVAQEAGSGCCDGDCCGDNCCEGDCGGDCCDCDCGDCDCGGCDCGGCDCDCNCFG